MSRKFAVGAAAVVIALSGAHPAAADPENIEPFVQKYGVAICTDIMSAGPGQRTFWELHSYYMSQLGAHLSYLEIQDGLGIAVQRHCPQYLNAYVNYRQIY